MENPFSLPDDKLRSLLDGFSSWYTMNEKERDYIDRQRQKAKELKETLLNNDYLSKVPDNELAKKLLNYSRTLEGPAFIKLGLPRISDNTGQIKRNLLYLIDSSGDPFKKASKVLDGEYKIPIFSKSFWTPIFQAEYPNMLPNWNNRTERFFQKLGLDLQTPKSSKEDIYRQISDGFLYLQSLDPKLDFHDLNHLMHFGAEIPEGVQLLDKLMGIETKFQGFTEETFKLLRTLSENTSYEAVKAISAQIHEKAIRPLESLLKDVASRIDPKDILALEKEKNIVARLFKANPKLGAWPYIWGAVFKKGEKRQKSMQFYVFIEKDSLTFGIYPSKNNPSIRKKIVENLKKYGEQLHNFVDSDFYNKYLFFTDYHEGEPREILKINGYEDLIPKFEEQNLNVGMILKPAEALEKKGKLVDLISSCFEALVPLYTFGISDKPIEILNSYYSGAPPVKETGKEISKEEILNEIFLEESRFDQIIALLKDKKQIILQGPPGTGKTFISKKIAEYLAKDKNRIETVQFHPSFSYEDFIEGYRPSESKGFHLQPGIFKSFCDTAEHDNNDFVLIIDEINRGSLSKIFGELLYLLEYRGEKVKLTYSSKQFCIPKNLLIIGTMNTADRSLAIMDYALRRRFCFVDLKCHTERLRGWLNSNGCTLNVDDLIKNVEKLNDRISHEMRCEDFAIGHSYFMKEKLDKGKLDEIIGYEIRPLLSEYFFDSRDKVEELLSILRK